MPVVRSTVSGAVRGCKSYSGRRPRHQVGLTIVELVLVIVIVGVLGAMAGPRFFDDRSFDARAYAEVLASMLRYAQKVAVGSGCRVRVDIAATSYQLTQQTAAAGHCDSTDASFTSPVGLPTGETAAGNAPSGVSVAAPLVVFYDALGRTDLVADRILIVDAHTLTIQAGSGLVTGP